MPSPSSERCLLCRRAFARARPRLAARFGGLQPARKLGALAFDVLAALAGHGGWQVSDPPSPRAQAMPEYRERVPGVA